MILPSMLPCVCVNCSSLTAWRGIVLCGLQKHHDWWSVMLFFIFNIFDTIGRYAPGAIKVFPEKTLWVRASIMIESSAVMTVHHCRDCLL